MDLHGRSRTLCAQHEAKALHIGLCVVGIAIPYTQFIPWVIENGVDVPSLLDQIASSRIAAFGWLDLVVSAVALFVFICTDRRRAQVSGVWLPIIGTMVAGVSLGLPLCLLLRELRLEAKR